MEKSQFSQLPNKSFAYKLRKKDEKRVHTAIQKIEETVIMKAVECFVKCFMIFASDGFKEYLESMKLWEHLKQRNNLNSLKLASHAFHLKKFIRIKLMNNALGKEVLQALNKTENYQLLYIELNHTPMTKSLSKV